MVRVYYKNTEELFKINKLFMLALMLIILAYLVNPYSSSLGDLKKCSTRSFWTFKYTNSSQMAAQSRLPPSIRQGESFVIPVELGTMSILSRKHFLKIENIALQQL